MYTVPVATTPGTAATGDRRVRRSQAALQCAFLELVEETDLARITVADVAERADVNRSTFYAHYRDVHELAEAASTATIDTLIDSLSALGPEDPSVVPSPSLVAFFTHLADHAGLYRSLLGPGGSARVVDHILRRTTMTIHRATCLVPLAGTEHDVRAGFVAGGLIGAAIDWLQRGCPEAPSELAVWIRPLVERATPPPDATG
jgi:AcrR family transcriptional regulator